MRARELELDVRRGLDPWSRCFDCGAPTTPCTGRRGCRHMGRWEWYRVHDIVWALAGMPWRWPFEPSYNEYLCIGCLERRLERQLTSADFLPTFGREDHINAPHPWDTPRLAAAKLRPSEALP